MKHIAAVQSYSRRFKGLVCMSDDANVLKEFKRATDALQEVSQLARKTHRKEQKK